MIKMENKKFKMIDEEFICENCQEKVEKLSYTARDHCPKCLYSKHLDVNPGDRMSTCKSLMKPVGIDKKKGEFQIVYECLKCKMIKKNKVAVDDDMSKVIMLSVVK